MCQAQEQGLSWAEADRQSDLSLLAKIEAHQWAVQGVYGADDPSARSTDFAYTVGMSTLGHPELAIFGVPVRVACPILNALAERLAGGEAVIPGSPLEHAIGGPDPAVAIEMTDTSQLVMVTYIYGEVDAALQIVWPDPHGHFPWERPWSMGDAQPLFGPPPW